MINVIISEEAKTLHFVGQMYKSDYFIEEQMAKYEMQRDADKVWTTTLQFFTGLNPQCKAYSNDHVANSGFDSEALVLKYPLTEAIAPLPAQPGTSQRTTSMSKVSKSHNRRHANMLPGNAPWPRSLTQRPFYAPNSKPNASSLISS